jgi:hypothetical protein
VHRTNCRWALGFTLDPAVPSVRPLLSLLRRRGRPPAASLDLWSAGTLTGARRRKSQDLPGSWGNPGGRMPCSLTPVGLLAPGQFSAGVLSPLTTTRTTPTTSAFRGSIARPSASLSTLRRRPYGIGPRKTRFRLVASLCRAGFTCRVPYKRFPLCRLTSTSLPPFPGLAWRTEGGTSRIGTSRIGSPQLK